MKWTTQHDIEFGKEVVASQLFETKKGQQKELRYGKVLSTSWRKWKKKAQIVLNAKSERVVIQLWHFWQKRRKKKERSRRKANRLERERLEYEKEKTEKFMQQQRSDMLAAMVEIQRQQNNQVKPSQMILLQQQQQQGQSLIALLSKIVDKEN